MEEKVKVLKFGGSSVGTPERIRVAKQIVEGNAKPAVVVVSAFQGVTDQLLQLCQMAKTRTETYRDDLENLLLQHISAVDELIPTERRSSVHANIRSTFNDLEYSLYGIYLLRELTPKAQDYILSFGERLSSLIISHVFEDAVWLDAREFIRTNDKFGKAKVDFETSDTLITEQFKGFNGLAVVPGFIGSTGNEETTTLGRGGSDYTAAIIAAAIHASILEIWTDVDGFMTADPRVVEKAYPIENMTYAEAIELSHFGAKVIYTPTIQPVYQKNIPLHIRNSFNLDAPGTLISSKENGKTDKGAPLIRGVSSVEDVSLLTLQGTCMVGAMGTSMRLFGALARAGVNVILITQASSEFSITFAILPHDLDKAQHHINEEFETEMQLKNSMSLAVENDLSIIAVVGEQMKNVPGVSASLFRSLARNGISVIATAQGSSELNISVAIRRESLKKAMNSIHEGFFLSGYKELHLFQVGIGTVGNILLQQLAQQRDRLLNEHRLKINLMGVTNSRKMLIDPNGIDLSSYNETLDKQGEPANIDRFVEGIRNLNLRNSVFIDCTAHEVVANKYKDVLDSFVSVVTANKIACSAGYAEYSELKATARKRNVRFQYETNVGAGLPIINTMNDLRLSGDKVLRLEAVLSGTLNFLFNTLSEDMPLSKTVMKAKELGYSEPDPRIDLSGIDVVRKLLILSREAEYPIEKDDVDINTFLPDECFEGTVDDFWEKLKSYDQEFEERRKELVRNNKKWRFVASLDEGKAKVELRAVGQEHPAYALEGSTNIVVITTERYKELPMVIIGYGAGADVTAAGVFADIMRIANV